MALTKLNNQAVANITTLPVALGDMVLVSSATASSSASIEFSLGNYKEYKFFFVNIHPSTSGANLSFQCSTDSGSTYATTMTTTFFRAAHDEADTTAVLGYDSGFDLAQSTSFQPIMTNMGIDNDMCGSGSLQLFNPSSNTFVKHFVAETNIYQTSVFNNTQFIAGYANTTSALTNIKFQMSSGNIDAGTILMYGVN